jgi:CBS domain-containing protein
MTQTGIPTTVAEVMSRDVVSVDENDHLSHLLDSMHALRVRHMPVTDGRKLVGMLSERDALRLSASSLLPNGRQSDELLQKRFYVRDVMTRDVRSVSAGASLREVGEIMVSDKVDCVPVVDAENVLVGIVTSTDLIKLVVDLSPDP